MNCPLDVEPQRKDVYVVVDWRSGPTRGVTVEIGIGFERRQFVGAYRFYYQIADSRVIDHRCEHLRGAVRQDVQLIAHLRQSLEALADVLEALEFVVGRENVLAFVSPNIDIVGGECVC